MTYNTLLVEPKGKALIVTLNRPQALNALNQEMMRELDHFFLEGYTQHPGMSAIIIIGSGEKAFAAGADIKEFLGLDATQGKAMAAFGHQVFSRIERFHLPVMAAVNGFALGGGCELAMSCHIRIASEKARFGQPEVNLGLIPGYGGTQRLIQTIGKSRAMDWLMTADMISADQALSFGLVSRISTPENLLTDALALADKISTKAPIAIRKIIECVNAYFEEGSDGFAAEVEAFGACTATEDFKEGAAAFVEKRPADFQGR
jgi:enoyl-CoA hydratase